MSLWILRVYLKAGPVVELIYDGADACRAALQGFASPAPLVTDDYGKALTLDNSDQVAACMTSDYDAELSGVDQVEKCKAGLRAKLQQRAAAQAGLIGGHGPMMRPANGGLLAP